MADSHTTSCDEKTSLLRGKDSAKCDYILEDPINRNLEWRVRFDKYNTQLTSTTYTWKNLSVWIGPDIIAAKRNPGIFSKRIVPEQSQQILTNVSGVARPGELLGILGSSGAGKSTLLNVLTFRNTQNLRIHGDRLINGVPVGPEDLTNLSAYIQQDDLFIGTLTVKEHLIFQALLKMPKEFSYAERILRVNQVIQELGLSKCEDTLIGIPGRISGISGGEKKRLAFASEVLTDPLLLFCDEPTSGLDSFMAQNVIEVLNQMSRNGKSIIATIHQPSSEIFALFDKIILISEGRIAFQGSSDNALLFFSRQGLICPLNFNPADYFIEALAVLPGYERETRLRIKQLCDRFEKSSEGIELQNICETSKQLETAEFLQMKSAISNQSKYKASWISQFRAVFWRSWLTILKEPMLIRMRIYQTFVVSLLFGILYFGQDLNQNGIMNMSGFLFICLTSLTFQHVMAVVDTFSTETPIFLREHFNGMYRTDVYFLSKTFAELPLQIFFPVVFDLIAYFMVGLNSDILRFLNSVVILILISNVTCSYGYMISCLCSSASIGMAVAPASMLPFMIFGGFFLNRKTIPPFLSWIRYLSWYSYAYEALSINQWDGINQITCHRSNVTCLENGDAVLNSLHFNTRNFTFDLIGLVSLIFIFRTVAFIALLRKTIRRD